MNKVLLVALASPNHYSCWNNLSVEVLAGDIRGYHKSDVAVQVLSVPPQGSSEPVAADIAAADAMMIGFSVCPNSVSRCREIISLLRTRFAAANRHPLVVFGNRVPTYFPSLFLEMMPDAVVVCGEGEQALRDLIEHLLHGRPLHDIPNLVYMDAGREVNTPRIPLNYDTLVFPPSLDTVDRALLREGNALVQSSRGCSWARCSFCESGSWRPGQGWRPLPLGRVLSNIRELANAGIGELEFADDDFMGGSVPEHLDRIDELAKGIEEIGRQCSPSGRLTFRIFLNPPEVCSLQDDARDRRAAHVLSNLKSAGLVRVYMGVDSGCVSQLRRYRRPVQLMQTRRALDVLRGAGLGIDVGFIMFDPLLTLQEMLENTRVFREWGLIRHNQWPFRPLELYSGVPLFHEVQELGLLGELDESFGSYSYRYVDQNVECIAQTVDRLSRRSRAVFFALKSLTKRQFDPSRRDSTAVLAQRRVEQNGLVFLDLLEQSAQAFLEGHRQVPESVLKSAAQAIDVLVSQTEKDIAEGLIVDTDGFLRTQIELFHHGEVSRTHSYEGASSAH